LIQIKQEIVMSAFWGKADMRRTSRYVCF